MAKKTQRNPKSPNDNDERSRDSRGDTMRKWRRRYESLRDDYEELLDRLEMIEALIEDGEESAPAPGAPITPGTLRSEVRQVVLAPWFLLREEYAEAARDIQSLVTEMDAFAHRSFKGQRPASSPQDGETETSRPPADPEELRERAGPTSPPTMSVQVQVRSPNLGALLDFQERLTQMSEVVRVSMSQVNEDRAVLIVDLDAERAEPEG